MIINGIEFKIRYTLRALFIYELITGKVFSLQTLTDEYLFFYCILLANNPEMNLTFDDLIDAIDDEPKIMVQFQEFMKSELEKQSQFITKEADIKKKS